MASQKTQPLLLYLTYWSLRNVYLANLEALMDLVFHFDYSLAVEWLDWPAVERAPGHENSDVNKDLNLKARTKDQTLKAKDRTKDQTLKAKHRTKDLSFKAKAKEPRTVVHEKAITLQ